MIEPIIRTYKNILLKGKYLKTQSKSCVIFVPGLGGTFDNIGKAVADTCIKEGYSFIWAKNQSCYIDKSVKKLYNGEIIRVNGGAMYENFNNAIPDLSAWVDFAIDEGYSKIVFMGHCYGCSKIVYLHNKRNLDMCIGNLFIAPVDLNLLTDPRYASLVDEAVKNVKNKQPNKLISKQLYGYCDLTSAAFLRLCYNPFINNMPYRHENGKFNLLENINSPILYVLGSQDGGLYENKTVEYATALMQRLKNHSKKGNFKIIENAKHSFSGSEKDLCDVVSKFLKQLSKEGDNEHLLS